MISALSLFGPNIGAEPPRYKALFNPGPGINFWSLLCLAALIAYPAPGAVDAYMVSAACEWPSAIFMGLCRLGIFLFDRYLALVQARRSKWFQRHRPGMVQPFGRPLWPVTDSCPVLTSSMPPCKYARPHGSGGVCDLGLHHRYAHGEACFWVARCSRWAIGSIGRGLAFLGHPAKLYGRGRQPLPELPVA